MVQAIDDYETQEDLPQALRLLGEMNTNVNQVTDLVESMLKKVKTGELSTEYGLSFLEIKYHMLLTYLINLTYVVLRKCSGMQIEKDPAIDRLIEIRTVLEKIRPIDYKLRYQIDKLVKTAITGTNSATDPSSFKPNPSNLISQLPGSSNTNDDDANDDDDDDANNGIANGDDNDDNDSDDSTSSDDEDEEKHSTGKKSNKKLNKLKKSSGDSSSTSAAGGGGGGGGLYVPPKLSAVHYDGEDSKAERNRKQLERAKKRALSSSLIQDLKEEYLDVPTEVSAGSRAQQILSKAQKEKQEYEEAYLTRLPITKAEKHRQRKLTTLGTLGDELTSFADISALDGRTGGGSSSSTSNKRKRKSTQKKRGGKNKKRKFH